MQWTLLFQEYMKANISWTKVSFVQRDHGSWDFPCFLEIPGNFGRDHIVLYTAEILMDTKLDSSA